eukprot:5921102-Lingulodinium_polyedra.AAC.1
MRRPSGAPARGRFNFANVVAAAVACHLPLMRGVHAHSGVHFDLLHGPLASTISKNAQPDARN